MSNDKYAMAEGEYHQVDKQSRHNPYNDFLYIPRKGPHLEWGMRIPDVPRSFTDFSYDEIDAAPNQSVEQQVDISPPNLAARTRDVPHIIFSNSGLGTADQDPNVVPVDVVLQRINSSSSQTRHSSRRGSVTSLARSSSTGSRGSSPRHMLVGDPQNQICLISKHKLAREYQVSPDNLYRSQKICQASGGIQFAQTLQISEFSLPIFTQVVILATSNLGLNQDTKHLALTIGSIYLLDVSDLAERHRYELEIAKVALMIAIKMRERDTKLPSYKLIETVCMTSYKSLENSELNSSLNIASPKSSNHSGEKLVSQDLTTGTTTVWSNHRLHKHRADQQSPGSGGDKLTSKVSLPSLESVVSCKFGWNLSFLTVHDYMVRFFFIGILLDTDKLVGYQRSPNSPGVQSGIVEQPTHAAHGSLNHQRIYSEQFEPTGTLTPRNAISLEQLPEDYNPIIVKSLTQPELKTLLTQIESDAALLCDLLSERVLIPLRQAQVYAFYLLLLARAMSKISEDK